MLKKRIWGILAIVCMFSVIVACSNSNNNNNSAPSEGQQSKANESPQHVDNSREDWPDKIVIGRVPSEDEHDMNRKYEPFRKYLEERLGLEVEMYVGTSYTAVIEAMRNGHVDVGTFGAFSYVLANARAKAESFVTSLSAPDAEGVYYSVLITLEDSGIQTLEDLKGKSFVFADSASTSGYLFPRAHLINELELNNATLDNYFSNVAIAGPQESVFLSVLNGDADAGSIADITLATYLEKFKDHANIDKIKVFEKTDGIPRGAKTQVFSAQLEHLSTGA